MAKRRFRRRFRKRNKWAPNIQRVIGSGTAPYGSNFMDSITIAQNPVQNVAGVSQAYTVKNVEIAAQLEVDGSGGQYIENVEYYILYVPEGYPISDDLPFSHPEWIMAYKFLGNPTQSSQQVTSNAQPPRIRTRLSRKLQTGDSIIFMICGRNTSVSNPYNIRYHGLVRWWTKAN